MQCPKCRSYGGFNLEVVKTVKCDVYVDKCGELGDEVVTQEDTDYIESVECTECGYIGIEQEFI